MTNNCLVKELMADFNNDNLPRFGEVVLTLKSTASNTRTNFIGDATHPFSMRIEGDGVFTNSSYTSEGTKKIDATLDGNYRVYAFLKNVSNGDKLIIEGKYTLRQITYSGDANRFESLLDLKYVSLLEQLQLSGDDKCIIDIESLSLANAVLSSLRVVYNTNCTGSVEKFVENQLAAGRISGTCEMSAYYTGVTINGSAEWNKSGSSSAKLTITYNSATNVEVSLGSNTLATYSNGTWSYPS